MRVAVLLHRLLDGEGYRLYLGGDLQRADTVPTGHFVVQSPASVAA
jgi:hypothetical protein